MDNDETKRIDIDEINSNIDNQDTLNRETSIFDTLNTDTDEFETIDEDLFIPKSISDFEEIDNENNLSTLEKSENVLPKTHLQQKGFVRKPEKPKEVKRVKRKSTRNLVTEDEETTTPNIYVITLIVAVVVCIIVFLIVFNIAVSGNNGNKNVEDKNVIENEQKLEDEIIEENLNVTTSIGLVEDVAKSGSIQIFDFVTQESVNLKYVSTTKLLDRYGKPLVIDEITVGSIVDYTYPNDKTTLDTIAISNSAFRENKLTNAVNDTTAKTLTFDKKPYNYIDNTIVDFERGTYTAQELGKYDVLNISGYEDTIYYIEVLKGHGEVKFIQNSQIINGTVEIDTTDTYNANELSVLTLAEGAHQIVVKGDNIDPYVTNILVEPNKTTEVSLLLAQGKQGLLIPTVTPNDYIMRIDGQMIDTSKPILLDYGPHTINVSKDGYETFQTTVTIASQETRINIKLDQRVVTGKVNITTEPSGANVYVDNAYVGLSPITAPINYGNHTILIKLDGYTEITYPVEVTKDSNSLFFPLQKSESAVQ